ncbi:transmembrane proteins 14C [Wolffia australiana]
MTFRLRPPALLAVEQIQERPINSRCFESHKPVLNLCGRETAMAAVSGSLTTAVSPRRNPSAASPKTAALRFGAVPLIRHPRIAVSRRFQVLLAFSGSKDSSSDELGGQNDLRKKAEESLETWKQMLESAKVEAIKMRSISQESYELYSKKAMVILKETSENLKIQADQAREDMNNLAVVLNQEGREYLSTAAKTSPESVKDIVETFATSPDDLKVVSDVRDFYLGIPYGSLLAGGGFLHFMLTGSLSGVRFGVILGGALLALSVLSLRVWKTGQSSMLYLKGQAAIAGILFIREWNLVFKRLSFSSFWATVVSGGMLAFYLYRILLDSQSDDQSLRENPADN